MNKSELIAEIAKDIKTTKTDAGNFFNSMVSAITRALKKEGKVLVPGFLNFTKIKRDARAGRNPQTGKEIKIPGKNIIKIKPGKALTDAVN